ncbi:hypothetical protein AB0K00_13660 [Dactylosporangium sp. NPDC049525]|uniref:hypothetical protein n=1 Tax=Dactylosporangium sp. NPDC049525 TaxID=3154730 RepID=UPI00343F06D2
MTAFLELQQNQPAPSPRTRPRSALALAGVAVAAVAATVVALTVAQPEARPAYALSPNGDGSMTFTINDASDPAGATETLRAAGIHAVVLPGHRPGECPADQRGTRDSRAWSTLITAYESFEYRRTHPDALHSVVIRPDRIPAGTILVIGMIEGRLDGERRVFVHPELFTDPGPACYETDLNVEKLMRIEQHLRSS